MNLGMASMTEPRYDCELKIKIEGQGGDYEGTKSCSSYLPLHEESSNHHMIITMDGGSRQ